MYNDYFGFNERPFRLVSDSAYLFLSKSYEKELLIFRTKSGIYV